MSALKEALEHSSFVVTGEIGPPKGVDLGTCLNEAEMMRDRVTAVNVTDQQSAVMRVGSMAVSRLLVERGLEPVFQLTCRDRNRLALQSDLLSAWALGIQNVLCLTGDHPVMGDHPESKAVYDVDSVQLLKAASDLNQGVDMAGHELTGNPDFFLGAVVTPGAEPVEPQIIKMKKKINAGAAFFQTQAIFDPAVLETFMERAQGTGVPVIAGIIVCKSAGAARFMNANIAGIRIPDEMIKEYQDTSKQDLKKKAVEIAARTIRQIKPFCQGVHIMPMGWNDLVPAILEEADLR